MRKYFKVFSITLQEALAYRLNFVMWRLRQIFVFLIPYYIWLSVLGSGGTIYGYQFAGVITYLFGTTILRSLVMGSRSVELGWIINSGNLSLYLLKPINLFKYWFTRDLADKLYNLSFIAFEIPLLYFIFRPPIFLQTNILTLLLAVCSTLLAIMIYFFLNLLFGCIGFWSKDIWAPRFMLMVILEFTTGAMFPLDMLGAGFQKILYLTPFPYLLFVPLKIYLGSDAQALLHIATAFVWMIILYLVLKFTWKKGIYEYEAEGR